MGELRCVDGSVLTVDPKPCHDRGGAPFEITLELSRNGRWFGVVGERCGYFLATLAVRLAASRTPDSPQVRCWPNPDDRFPEPVLADPAAGLADPAAGHVSGGDEEHGPPLGRPLPPYLWRERELFAFRRRDRADGAGMGELRCTVRTFSTWLAPGPVGMDGSVGMEGELADRNGSGDHRQVWSAPGRWWLARRAIIEAWGSAGRGVRATLTSTQLATFLTDILDAAERAGTSYRDLIEGASAPELGR